MWEVSDDFEDGPSSLPLLSLRNERRMVSIILVDGSARTRLHLSAIPDDIFRCKSDNPFYVVLVYGDYPPSSINVVETVYTGGEYDALLSALRQWSFAGGTPVRNALHEGFAAAMDVIRTMLLRDEGCQLTVIGCSLYYEEFQAAVPVQASVVQQGRVLEEMLLELRTRGRVRLSCLFPSPELGRTFFNLLGKVYPAEELRPVEIGGWIGRTTEVKQSAASIRSNASGDSINLDINLDTLEVPISNSLEQAVRQFLSVVLKLPQNQRAEAIKRHLESPTYSAEYKQCLVAMVRQMQNTAKMVRKPPPSMPPAVRPVTSPPIIPRQPPMARGPNVMTPVWRGRLAFRTNTEAYFDIAAVPIPNPKSSYPQTTPLAPEYDLDSWPLVLAVSSFVSVQSPAVIKSVPVSKLVELFAVNPDGTPAMGNETYVGFRNLLATRQLVRSCALFLIW
jgi:hypothetical protein